MYYSNGKVLGHTMKLSFWWKSILKLLTTYKRFAQAEAGTGETILFWKDMWNGQFLQSIFPELYSFASNENITLSTVLHQEALHDIFNLPLSEETYFQYCELEILVQSIEDHNDKDKWKYIWDNDQYTSARAYRHLIGTQQTHPAYRWLWASYCQPKHKVFFWLLLKTD
jgi:hypothetical protein